MTIHTDRRGLLFSAAALSLGGCVHCRFPSNGTADRPFNDAHAHFFNVADLPVAGFAKHVLIPRHFPGFPPFAYALIDIIAWVAKALALSADQEARQLGAGSIGLSASVEPRDFGREAAKAHRMGLRDVAPIGKVDRLGLATGEPPMRSGLRAESHRALAALLVPAGRSSGKGRAELTEADFAAIADEAQFRREAPQEPDGLQCPAPKPDDAFKALPGVRHLLHWAYLMCKPRCAHVNAYLDTIQKGPARVAEAVNLMVDYDKWLDDEPRAGSETAQQVAYWTRYSEIAQSLGTGFKLHNFAGYDPLRDAEERVLDGLTATSFKTMQQWARDGRDATSGAPRKISGFKVYPPMGFRPDYNAKLVIPEERGGKAILRRWGNRTQQIGPEIDNSLNDFFDFCVREDIPVLTHARESNLAFSDNGLDPSPEHWLARAKVLAARYPRPRFKPLRLCIGHFDMINCSASQSDEQVLREALRLNKQREARIYFDVSFDDRILAGKGHDLFAEIAAVCTDVGDDGDYIMFGSDWIMLANQPNVADYLTLAYEAAKSVTSFWNEERLDKLFSKNMKRFLDPTAD